MKSNAVSIREKKNLEEAKFKTYINESEAKQLQQEGEAEQTPPSPYFHQVASIKLSLP